MALSIVSWIFSLKSGGSGLKSGENGLASSGACCAAAGAPIAQSRRPMPIADERDFTIMILKGLSVVSRE